jgi:hypothetical protein
MQHVGYTCEKTIVPEPLGIVDEDVAGIQEEIDALYRRKQNLKT